MPRSSLELPPEKRNAVPTNPIAVGQTRAMEVGAPFSVTLTTSWSKLWLPSSSVTVSATVYVPEEKKAWAAEATGPRTMTPSPKSNEYSTIAPSGSLDPLPSNESEVPTLTVAVDATRIATGARPQTVTPTTSIASPPSPSSTMRRNRYTPIAVGRNEGSGLAGSERATGGPLV